jgi:lysozyme
LKTNARGISLIRQHEQCRLDAYPDPGGVPTIGWGHTGKDVRLGMRITPETAELLFQKDLAQEESVVWRYAGEPLSRTMRPLNENEFSALVSFTFNEGIGSLLSSTLLRLLVGGAPREVVADQFARWNKMHVNRGGKLELVVSTELVQRRRDERELFLAA